ncbi:hypothetical protein N2152v2_000652 [Parachlorella kessleri]
MQGQKDIVPGLRVSLNVPQSWAPEAAARPEEGSDPVLYYKSRQKHVAAALLLLPDEMKEGGFVKGEARDIIAGRLAQLEEGNILSGAVGLLHEMVHGLAAPLQSWENPRIAQDLQRALCILQVKWSVDRLSDEMNGFIHSSMQYWLAEEQRARAHLAESDPESESEPEAEAEAQAAEAEAPAPLPSGPAQQLKRKRTPEPSADVQQEPSVPPVPSPTLQAGAAHKRPHAPGLS